MWNNIDLVTGFSARALRHAVERVCSCWPVVVRYLWPPSLQMEPMSLCGGAALRLLASGSGSAGDSLSLTAISPPGLFLNT
ncbi:hypothetical protein MHYP_G00255930 [Metynnis hypsauchen]